VLQSSAPVGLLGHESGFAPDGRTFYATSLSAGTVTAVDVTNPRLPAILGVFAYPSHGLTVSDDGNHGYVAGSDGLQVVNLSEVQARKPNPYAPKELAYFVAPPGNLGGSPASVERSNYAMSKPAFNSDRGEIWYSDGNSGFYALRVANGVWPFEAAPSAVGFPSARRCASRRAFTVRLRAPRGAAALRNRESRRQAGEGAPRGPPPDRPGETRGTDEGHHHGQRRRAHHLGPGRPRDADLPDLQKGDGSRRGRAPPSPGPGSQRPLHAS
jgi:hypothetical protein